MRLWYKKEEQFNFHALTTTEDEAVVLFEQEQRTPTFVKMGARTP
jgi:hypothetical protein